MPHIIVVADGNDGRGGDAVMLRERIIPSDLQSRHFATHLIERLGWAVEDAREVELRASRRPDTHEVDLGPAGLEPFEVTAGRVDHETRDLELSGAPGATS